MPLWNYIANRRNKRRNKTPVVVFYYSNICKQVYLERFGLKMTPGVKTILKQKDPKISNAGRNRISSLNIMLSFVELPVVEVQVKQGGAFFTDDSN